MCADESDEYILRRELDDHYHPIVIPLDVEHISLIAYTIYRIKSSLDVSKILLLCRFRLLNPTE